MDNRISTSLRVLLGRLLGNQVHAFRAAPPRSRRNISVAIEGPIGVGKTTLARLLQKHWDADLLLERFEENPFLAGFYTDSKRYAFQAQLFFLLDRLDCLDKVAAKNRPRVSDYIFAKNNIFAKLILNADELMLYHRLYDRVTQQIPAPDLVIYLKADIPTLQKRIQGRNRVFERTMDKTYVERLSQAYEDFFKTYAEAPVLMLDTSNLDVIHSVEARTAVLEYIESAIRCLQPAGAPSPAGKPRLQCTQGMIPA